MPAYFLALSTFHATRHFLSVTGASGWILLPARSQASFPSVSSLCAGPAALQSRIKHGEKESRSRSNRLRRTNKNHPNRQRRAPTADLTGQGVTLGFVLAVTVATAQGDSLLTVLGDR